MRAGRGQIGSGVSVDIHIRATLEKSNILLCPSWVLKRYSYPQALYGKVLGIELAGCPTRDTLIYEVGRLEVVRCRVSSV